MGWFDWLVGGQPAPALPAPAARVDAPSDRERLDATRNALTRIGTESDRTTAARPGYGVVLTNEERFAVWAFNGLMRRAINLKAGDATRRGWRLEIADENDDPLAKRWADLGVRAAVKEALIWSMVYEGAAIWIQAADAGASQVEPLRPGARVLRLVVLAGSELSPAEYQMDALADDPGGVETWNVTVSGTSRSYLVHRSRMLVFPGVHVPREKLAEYNGLGLSWIDSVWQAVADYDQTDRAAAVIASEMKQAVMKIDGLAELATEDQAELLQLRMRSVDRARGTIGMLVLDQGDEYSTQVTSVAGFKDLSETMRLRVAAWLGVPQAKLFGVAPGGLSTDDNAQMANWRDQIADLQHDDIRPNLEYLARHMLAEIGRDPEDGWALEFEALDEPSAAEQADIELKHAQTDAARIQTGVLDPDHVARSRFRPRGYSAHILPLDEDQIDAMADPVDPSDEDLGVLRGPR